MEREDFDRVWRRVQGERPSTETAETEAELLRRLSALLARQRVFARYLGEKSASCRERAAWLGSEKARQLSLLQRRYFLLTGEELATPEADAAERGVVSALREAFLRERESAALCRRAVGAAGERVALYAALAAEEERHARMLRHLLERSWG